jgi:hypothetical protein
MRLRGSGLELVLRFNSIIDPVEELVQGVLFLCRLPRQSRKAISPDGSVKELWNARQWRNRRCAYLEHVAAAILPNRKFPISFSLPAVYS